MNTTIEEVIKDAIRQGMQESSDEHLGNANIHRADLDGLIAQAQSLLSQGDYLEMLNQCPTGDEVEDYLTYPLPKIEPVGYLRFISNTNVKFIHNLLLKGASPFITPYPDIPVYLAPPSTEALQKDKAELIEYAEMLVEILSLIDKGLESNFEAQMEAATALAIPQPKCME